MAKKRNTEKFKENEISKKVLEKKSCFEKNNK